MPHIRQARVLHPCNLIQTDLVAFEYPATWRWQNRNAANHK
jgi:hypothetical protein